MTETCLIDDLSLHGLLSGEAGAGLAAEMGCRDAQTPVAAPQSVPQDDGALGRPEQIAPGVFFLKGETRYFRDGIRQGAPGSIRSLMCNNGWVVLGDHVLLVDANMPGRADALIAAVRSTTDKPIRYVFNTHHHGDHIYGNRAIVERTGAEVVAYAGMVAELRRYETGAFGGPPGRREQVAQFRPDVAAAPLMLPTLTFERPMVLEGGGRRVELRHLGFGHTRGDAVAWVPDAGVVFTGDLVANGAFNIVRDAEMTSWIDTLVAMQELKPSIVCPGHGARGGSVLLDMQKGFFISLVEQVRLRIDAGRTREAVLADLETIRAALLDDPAAAGHVIPSEADLSVLSLRAQVERTFDQLQA